MRRSDGKGCTAHHSLIELAAENPVGPDDVRPLLLVHGLVDDNVVAAHTLRLSAALLATGRPHAVIPLTGATHMAASSIPGATAAPRARFLRRTTCVIRQSQPNSS